MASCVSWEAEISCHTRYSSHTSNLPLDWEQGPYPGQGDPLSWEYFQRAVCPLLEQHSWNCESGPRSRLDHPVHVAAGTCARSPPFSRSVTLWPDRALSPLRSDTNRLVISCLFSVFSLFPCASLHSPPCAGQQQSPSGVRGGHSSACLYVITHVGHS